MDDHPEGVIEKASLNREEYWYKDVVDEARDEAVKEVGDLYKQMSLDFGSPKVSTQAVG